MGFTRHFGHAFFMKYHSAKQMTEMLKIFDAEVMIYG